MKRALCESIFEKADRIRNRSAFHILKYVQMYILILTEACFSQVVSGLHSSAHKMFYVALGKHLNLFTHNS